MKEVREEKGDSRKNIVLLTIIAIATMIVVLVGATFAYLASQVSANDVANIEAATNAGNDMFLINAGGDMEIYADLNNFYSGSGNQVDNTEATVTLQTTTEENVTYTYNAYVTVNSNNFEYTSGTCYRKGTLVSGVTQNECEGNSNYWAETSDGSACFSGTLTAVDGSFNNNSIGCLTDVRNMWIKEDAAELVIDLYKVDETISTENACTAAGICVTNLRATVNGVTTEGNCTGDNIWISGKYDSSMCYVPIISKDLTVEDDNSSVPLVTGATITANNSTTTDRYFAEVTLINYNHNQIVNGNKNFSGLLTFERVTS